MSELTIIQFSKKDLMAGKVYEPSWYRVRLDSFSKEPSKNLESPSTNYVYSATILFDSNTGNTQYAEHPLTIRFNSKALGFVKGFAIALGVPEESIDENFRFAFENAVGKELDVMVENGQYEGRLNNQVNKYRLPRQS